MKPKVLCAICGAIAGGLFFSESLGLTGEPATSVDLPAKARTILKQHCFQCHGEDPENMEGDGLAILDYKMLVERKIVVARQAR
jgi:mono/diheme cytochrome c family protein